MKNIIYILLISITTNLSAQKDTLYFNQAWNKTRKADATYFRPLPLKKLGDLYQVKDYHSNGNLQMNGFWSNVENETLEGKAIWYNENGKPFEEGEYKNGFLDGISSYYSPEGFLRARGSYKNGKMVTGTFQRRCCPGGVSEYSAGQKVADLSFYQGIDQLAKKEIYTNRAISEIGYFDKKGNSIGQISYKDNEAVDGKFIWFYMDDNQATRAISIKKIITYKNGIRDGETIAFNQKGTEKARGLYKDDQPWEGSFYEVYSSFYDITSFKEGKKNGLFTTYDMADNVISKKEYKNDKHIKSEIYFEEPPYNLKQRTLLEEGKKKQETSYHNDKKYELNFKDGEPYNGVEYNFSQKGSITYLNGEKHGAFINEYTSNYAVKVSGNYTNGNFDGEITYNNTALNKETICSYVDDIPMDGTIMADEYITTYIGGKKHGLETSLKKITYGSTPYDSISRNYLMGQLDGEIQFYENNELLATGVYKKNAPYTGVFYEESTGTIDYINEYAKGELVKNELNFREIRQTTTYKSNKKHQNKFYNKKQLIAEGLYKNNQPYDGGFVVLEIKDPNYYHERYTLTNYKKGKKNGEEKLVNFKDSTLEKTITYRKNKIERNVNFIPFKDNDSIVGVYKNGKPFSGYFLYEAHENKTFSNTISVLNHYENGQKSGHQFFAVKGSRMQNVIDSIAYVKGKPFQGVELEEQDTGATLQHFYEKGKLTKTHMYMFGVAETPQAKISYTDNGFTTYYLVSKEFAKLAELTYTKPDKTEGNATLYRNDIKVGSFKFSGDEITHTQFSYKEGESQIDIRMDEPNTALIRIETRLELMTLEAKLKWSHKTKPTDFIKWEALLFKTDGIVNSYLKDKKTLIGTCIYKDGEEHNGVLTRINENGTYTYRRFENGEQLAKQENLTEEELIKIISQKK